MWDEEPGNFSGLEYFWKKDSKFNFESTVVQEKKIDCTEGSCTELYSPFFFEIARSDDGGSG